MTTRKIIIENEYLRLCKQITTILDKQIMPSLNTYDLSDILFMLIQHFSDVTNENYKQNHRSHYKFYHVHAVQ